MCLAEFPGSQADQIQESTVEITDVVESDIHCDVGYFIGCFNKAELRLSDAEDIHIMHWRILKLVLEYMGNIIRTQRQCVGNILQRDFFGVVTG